MFGGGETGALDINKKILRSKIVFISISEGSGSFWPMIICLVKLWASMLLINVQ